MDNVDTVIPDDNVSTPESLITGDQGEVVKDGDAAPVVETDVVVETGTDYEKFISGLPEEMRNDPAFEKFKSTEDFAKSYIEQAKFVGKRSAIPDADASLEDWAKFYDASGRPEDATKYNIDMPDTLKATTGAAERNMAALNAAHEAGLSEKQAAVLFDKLYASESAAIEADNTAKSERYTASHEALKSEWGENFDTEAQKIMAFEKQLGVFDKFEESGLNTNSDFLLMMAKLAKDVKPDSSIDGMLNSELNDNSHTQIQAKIVKLIKEGNRAEAKELQQKLIKSYT